MARKDDWMYGVGILVAAGIGLGAILLGTNKDAVRDLQRSISGAFGSSSSESATSDGGQTVAAADSIPDTKKDPGCGCNAH